MTEAKTKTETKSDKPPVHAEKAIAGEESKPAAGAEAPAKASIKSSSSKRGVSSGRVYILSSFNNTVITITDGMGNAIAWASAGGKGFRGSRKNTPFAAQVAGEDVARRAFENGLRTVQVFISGPGAGRESALRALSMSGLKVSMIEDVTPIPHNGCRPPKRRRV